MRILSRRLRQVVTRRVLVYAHCNVRKEPMKTQSAKSEHCLICHKSKGSWFCSNSLSRVADLWPACFANNDTNRYKKRSYGDGRI